MPLATHPNATYEVVLSNDSNLPKNKRPVFVFRYLSVADWEEVARLSDEFDNCTDSKQMVDLAFRIIEKTLCDWRKMKLPSGKQIPFNIKRLKSMIALREATELMQAGVSQRPSLEDKKKFDSQSRFGMGRAAKTAPA